MQKKKQKKKKERKKRMGTVVTVTATHNFMFNDFVSLRWNKFGIEKARMNMKPFYMF